MDPRQQTHAEDEQFLLNMIAEGGGAQRDAPGQADDGSNTDIYLNMFGDRCEPHPEMMTLLLTKIIKYISQQHYLYSNHIYI